MKRRGRRGRRIKQTIRPSLHDLAFVVPTLAPRAGSVTPAPADDPITCPMFGRSIIYNGKITMLGIKGLINTIRHILDGKLDGDINIYVTSSGGDADSVAMFDAFMQSIKSMRQWDSQIIFYVVGMAYSAAATLVAMGDVVYLVGDASMMLHGARVDGMDHQQKLMQMIANTYIADIFSRKSSAAGYTHQNFMDILNDDNDYFFAGRSAVDAGLANACLSLP